ncbi:hypothetical protein [Natronorubrum sulfidifaciens]|uniref:Uncharacterized protein n=1 Tax=Natronorubrum sulfidifaciens JCM 14089 TaxID=1230460 RepID=L9WCY6_9EURY|nr:hypothetical protein [Natronorubrum sulfidifaciens]ELY47355.1 hypothetical protein C495_03817 [Natronorubrum sulfidifaciens JCM 14089]
MESNVYTPRIKRSEVDLIPLLPGLARILKHGLDVPELKIRHARLDEDGNWSIDDDIEAFLWYPGGPTQTCFWEITRFKQALDGSEQKTTDYYQTEYYNVPRIFLDYADQWIHEEQRMWFVVDVNNWQLEEWLHENGVLELSDEIIASAKTRNETIRNEHNDGMERGQGTTDD